MSQRPTKDWKQLSAGAIFATTLAILGALEGLRGLVVTFLLGIGPMAWVGGYLYRADIAATRRPARFSFLRVEGDDDSGGG